MELLNKIQQELVAPKNQYNSFGKYKYRSCEDILKAVKPLLGKATLVLSDKMEVCGGWVYVTATVSLTDGDKIWTASGSAREPESRKGMDASQITGCASSYARKYACNGLFCIDDTKDADTDEYANQVKSTPPPKPPQPTQTEQVVIDRISEILIDVAGEQGRIPVSKKIADYCYSGKKAYPSDIERAAVIAKYLAENKLTEVTEPKE